MDAPAEFRGPFRTDAAACAAYAEGAGISRIVPTAVAQPVDADDVATLVRWAAVTRAPLVPRGSGSSMAAGAIGAGVVADLSRLDGLEPVDAATRTVRCGPGVTRGRVEAAAAAHGLRFPPDPSSGAYCTVGGMASTNAAGAHTLRYGATRPWVAALDCVFADGARGVIRRGAPAPDVPAIRRFLAEVAPDARAQAAAHAGVRKDSSGYALGEWARSGELMDLLVGSEGTLALFVGLELRLTPLPGATASLLAAFPTLEQAVAAAVRARDAGASACELLDRTFLDVAAQSPHAPALPERTEAVLLAEVEGASAPAAADAARALGGIFAEEGATRRDLALDPDAEHALWELRHAASPILARLDPALRSMQFIEDAAVPPARLPEYVRGVRQALARRDVRGVIFGHAGDAHVHVNPLIDVRRPTWREDVRAILDEVTALVGALGGTLAGEHGDGRLRTPLLGATWPDAQRRLFARVKHAFDPAGILNPGVKVPLPGQPPVVDIKYDPHLPALPAPARRVLDRLERERPLYARSRLALLDESAADAPSR